MLVNLYHYLGQISLKDNLKLEIHMWYYSTVKIIALLLAINSGAYMH